MADNIPLSSIGIKISYCVETTAGTRPTSGYTVLKGLNSTPDFSVAPNTADATSFDNEEYTTKIQLLKEMPDNLEFGFRFGQVAYDKWDAMYNAYKAISDNKAMWICIDIPNFDKAIFIKGQPAKLGLPSTEANSGIDGTGYITPIGEPVYDTKPTDYEDD